MAFVMARPMPRPPPVMRTSFPVKSIERGIFTLWSLHIPSVSEERYGKIRCRVVRVSPLFIAATERLTHRRNNRPKLETDHITPYLLPLYPRCG